MTDIVRVVLEECVSSWMIRAETSTGYALDCTDRRERAQAEEVAREWCERYGFAEWEVVTMAMKKEGQNSVPEKKYQVILDKMVGLYGHDVEGRNWCTFTLLGEGHTTTCTECGATITGGWEGGRLESEEWLQVCSSHVELLTERKQEQ